MTPTFFHIAIDGPVAAGKGTVSRLVSQRLNFLYIDTGAMYRMAAYLAHTNNVSYEDETKIVELIEGSHMDMRNPTEEERDGRLTTVFLNGEDVSWKIRTEEISQGSSKVAVLPEVRRVLVEKQQIIAKGKNVIMEGRDITYRVLPNAQLKIYLTAKTKERAERRLLQLQQKGFDLTLEKVMSDIEQRDQRDMSRLADPLKKIPEAWEVDTSKLSIEEVVEKIVAEVEKIRSSKS
ncbi:MAG: cytidylate kinase [Candidatus Pacebacteria bacterium CG10_big_fil_rev_8_21_14_0_10_36_11]|nr:(d)CMP kinase [Candidatus Pacearchaeota archaeon]OIP73796.1 MAG: cytidylate kinase [Candidatus Pacebacteria bacterium CG2_30_36_39]PIR64618.1 MAG: cytidylate kinase [Candidatus Pacebacteria bacterium CG10_big_fil_rev_8_21_14_0_10_36_11]